MSGSNTEDLLAGRSGLRGLSNQSYTVSEANMGLVDIPVNALFAVIVVEGFDLSSTDQQLCCRWSDAKTSLVDLSDSVGFPIGHLGMIELKGRDALQSFSIKRLSSITANFPKISVGYYE